jgi:hypothetical protein
MGTAGSLATCREPALILQIPGSRLAPGALAGQDHDCRDRLQLVAEPAELTEEFRVDEEHGGFRVVEQAQHLAR